jgi:hypothetical protein
MDTAEAHLSCCVILAARAASEGGHADAACAAEITDAARGALAHAGLEFVAVRLSVPRTRAEQLAQARTHLARARDLLRDAPATIARHAALADALREIEYALDNLDARTPAANVVPLRAAGRR